MKNLEKYKKAEKIHLSILMKILTYLKKTY